MNQTLIHHFYVVLGIAEIMIGKRACNILTVRKQKSNTMTDKENAVDTKRKQQWTQYASLNISIAIGGGLGLHLNSPLEYQKSTKRRNNPARHL